jgi:hypothetical protein
MSLPALPVESTGQMDASLRWHDEPDGKLPLRCFNQSQHSKSLTEKEVE